MRGGEETISEEWWERVLLGRSDAKKCDEVQAASRRQQAAPHHASAVWGGLLWRTACHSTRCSAVNVLVCGGPAARSHRSSWQLVGGPCVSFKSHNPDI